MAANSWGSLRGRLSDHALGEPSPSAVHLGPFGAKRSRCTTQPSCSVLDPASSAPPGSSTGLARIGPSTPSGSRIAADQVRPPSGDVRTRPHHSLGLGPTL